MIEKTKQLVEDLMKNDDSGHGIDHINRVFDMAMSFAENLNCNKMLVALGALLHDVDDYKLFGNENQEQLTNTNRILNQIGADETTKNEVLEIVASIGYSKRLKGITPQTIEGMIVSDADMCDAIGVNALLRTHIYTLKHDKKFFDKDLWPIENMCAEKYTRKCADTSVCHLFEKCLKLKNLMFTEAGKAEAIERHNFTVNFLKQLFKEENAYDWEEYLERYLSNLD